MSPHHREEMIEAIVTDMNKIYRLFLERHPNFEMQGGQIHIVGHSLGSVVSFDILSHHNYSRYLLESGLGLKNGRSPQARGKSTLNRWRHRSGRYQNRTSRDPDNTSPVDLADIALQSLIRPRGISASAASQTTPFPGIVNDTMFIPRPRSPSTDAGLDIAMARQLQSIMNSEDDSVLLVRQPPWAEKKPFVAPFSRFDPQDLGTQSRYLSFPISKYFAFGSPLGLFLLLRYSSIGLPLGAIMEEHVHGDPQAVKGNLHLDEPLIDQWMESLTDEQWKRLIQFLERTWSGTDHVHPDAMHVYNIFHPNDPIAYRVEPLVSPSLSASKPSTIPLARSGGWKLNLDIATRAQGLFGSWGTIRDTLVATVALRSFTVPNQYPSPNQHRSNGPEDKDRDRAATPQLPRVPETALKLLNGRKGRLDFALQESMLENQYLSALSAHVAYWRDQNCTFFVLREILEM
jgi:hypothetical protein